VFIFCVYYICCIVIHVNSVHFAIFDSFITWQHVCCICMVGECNKMNIDAATDAIKEEHLPEEDCHGRVVGYVVVTVSVTVSAALSFFESPV